MENVVGCVAMVAITFPVSFYVARECLRGIIRMISGAEPRHVVSSHS